MRWRIYYGDGTTFSDRDGAPWEAPATDVAVIMQEQPAPARPPLKVRRLKTAYFWKPDLGWIGCDEPGLWDYLFNYRGIKAIVFGRTYDDDVYQAIEARAKREGVE